MSWGYWGIVVGLVVEVAVFFVCMTLLYPDAKGSPKTPSSVTDRPVEAVKHSSVSHRQAA
jgi:hypothetical protein